MGTCRSATATVPENRRESRLVGDEFMGNLCQEHGISADVSQIYHANKVLGEGSYGKVLQARHKLSGGLYAIKHIRCENKFSTKEWSLIMNEVLIMKSLTHPNIVRLYEVIDDPEEDLLFMVMELVTGGDLEGGGGVGGERRGRSGGGRWEGGGRAQG